LRYLTPTLTQTGGVNVISGNTSFFPFFANVDIESLKEIAKIGQLMGYEKDEWLFKQDEYANGVYLIINGSVGLSLTFRDDLTSSIDPLGRGEIIGWSALVEPQQWT
jgi:CRP-like cAMP-binding protein